ncbi:MAG: DUF72 domain-containing protein [Halofilum sp. (in: g-proteobacteria)]|nr:DUF72 domain-containing protein [Halofilum sp. (in: g-proteobacteria)]
MAELHVGTSGWSYPHWSGPFYPQDLPERDWLGYYARRFTSVEINNSFYRLPATSTLESWRDTVPAGFEFAVKASRYVTHMKKLKDPEDTMPGLLARMERLGDRLGPVLLQLPPHWRCNPERLRAFLEALPPAHRYAFELRDPSWFDERVFELLARFDAAFCVYDLAGTQSPVAVTAGFAYVRLHGPGDAYQGSYTDAALRGWADTFAGWRADGRDVYCYFDNDEAGYAAANAARLRELAGR